MSDLIEQSRAYVRLGMLNEAVECAEEAVRANNEDNEARAWLVRLMVKRFDYARAVELGREMLVQRRNGEHLHAYIALALHNLGDSGLAVGILLQKDAKISPWMNYLMACFLAASGPCDLAVFHLRLSLPDQRDCRGKTWLDGDLRTLWIRLASGTFSLPVAHLLMDEEFDLLCEWSPRRDEEWELDPANYRVLPEDLRAATRFDPETEAFVRDYQKAPPGSRKAARLAAWVWREISENQEKFDQARRIARERVLDAQPQYARAAWQRGDLCAARNHMLFVAETDSARLVDFLDIEELRPLCDEMLFMAESCRDFFPTLRRARNLSCREPESALEILGSLPQQWQPHPMLMHVRSLCLNCAGQHREAMACILRACEDTPDDAAPFMVALNMAREHGWMDAVKALHQKAHASGHAYIGWQKADAVLKGEKMPKFFTRDFRGQPDLGGQIVQLAMTDPPALLSKAPKLQTSESHP